MLWWDWTTRERLALVAAMLIVAATPWLVLGFEPNSAYNLGVLAGGTAFLAMPQMFAWFIFVGLRTGRVPARFGSEHRSVSPTWFWIVVFTYAGLIAMFLYISSAVVLDLALPSL